MIEIPTTTIVVRAIFLENNKYLQVFLDRCLYKYKNGKWKWIIINELLFWWYN